MKKSYTINIPAHILWKVILPSVIVAVIGGIVGGIIIVDKIIMPQVVGVNRDIVEVTSVKGLELEKAREAFYAAGLLSEIKSREYDDTIADGGVISQFPEPGSKVKKGRKIAVVISKGKEIAVIPDIRNLTEQQARIELRKKGISIGKIKKIYSDDKALDLVIEAFPQCGTTISREMEIDLFISKGPRPTHAVAPNLVGESLTSAKKMIEESGLVLGKISYQNNASLLPGTIISQSVAPGSKVRLESSINLEVSVIRK